MIRSSRQLVVATAALTALSWAAQTAAAPNIVLFISDDMGWNDVSYHGSEINTPEIDRLAAEGVRLERFYVQSVCSPTRASLFTGRTPLDHGVSSPFNPWYSRGMPVDEKLLPEYLREGGYSTHVVGKWHLGPNEPQYHPLNRGFDSFYGSLHGFLSNYEERTSFGRVDWQRDGETVIEDGYDTHLIADEAVRLIESRDTERPFLLYVAFHAPHSPLQAPAEAIAEYAHIEDENRRIYAAMVSEMDAAIGRVTNALDAAGISEDTLVMFFTDNGGVPHLGASNAPFRGGKNTPWEGGLRVPAVAYWPGVLSGGTVFNNRVTVMDLLPTFMDMADLPLDPPKPLAGYNLWPALSEGAPAHTGSAVFSNYVGGNLLHAYFKDEWKLVRGRNDDDEIQDFLFDIFVDPYEQNDVAADYPEILARLAAELDAMPKAEPLTRGETPPDFNSPGAPASIEPDTRPAIGTPFAESGPIPYPTENYSAE